MNDNDVQSPLPNLQDKARETREENMGNSLLDKITEMIMAQVYSGTVILKRIRTITTNPNKTRATKKKGKMYMVPRS